MKILQNDRGFQPSADRITDFFFLPFLHLFDPRSLKELQIVKYLFVIFYFWVVIFFEEGGGGLLLETRPQVMDIA